ncbi:MAG: hypothetical protein K2R93_21640 [Gemmatimonadaceae bacterium]|nr:hypothetical protein [Gemmatimonadaceae bacterium]
MMLSAAIALLACTPHPHTEPVSLPYSVSLRMASSETRRPYRIWVALPEGYRREQGPYPVLYAVDANAEFFTVVEAARLAAEDGDIPTLIVVGIGYDTPNRTIAEILGPRGLDLTPTVDSARLRTETASAKASGAAPPAGFGGGPAFLRFIKADLAPYIEREFNGSPDGRGFFGHSLGGLFGVYALLQGEGFFSRVLAGSPSLWWDNRAMFAAESVFASRHRALPAKVFLAAGELETRLGPDTEAFAEQLRAHQYEGLTLQTVRFAGERHDPVIPATISRGLRFLYAK